MTERELLESMSEQIGELVRHVAEVRQSNVKLVSQVGSLQRDVGAIRVDMDAMRGDIDAMRHDIRALDAKIDDKTDLLAHKIDHVVEYFAAEQTRDRTRFEEERFIRSAKQRKTEQRLDNIESRLARLEAASS